MELSGLKAVFMGTPQFAVPSLQALADAGVAVMEVITQPDRPAGRGHRPAISPVKALALKLGLPVFQPLKIKDPEAIGRIGRAEPDVIVVVGYGQIIPRALFDLPPLAAINVHASLLPKYRGAAPIQWAIARGETTTGVSTMRIEARLDAGDIFLQRETAIGAEETAPELSARLAILGADLLVETLRGLRSGQISGKKQNDAEATYAPLLKKEDGRIDWRSSAREIFNRVRGFDPWPGAYTTFRGGLLHIRRARLLGDIAEPGNTPPGALVVDSGRLRAAAGQGWLELLEVQPEGKKKLLAQEFINGWQPKTGEILGDKNP